MSEKESKHYEGGREVGKTVVRSDDKGNKTITETKKVGPGMYKTTSETKVDKHGNTSTRRK